MDKRYQVFVSSTYTDLIEERQVVMQTLMENDCIPAGMELFPAADEDQFEFIKRIIDDCDYYLIIIGGRYGSLAADGLSFTEKEYDYAISRGLKVIALVHSNSDQITVGKSEKDKKSKIKLEKFRVKVCKGRMVKFWNDKNQISGILSPSLSKTIKLFPAVGWVRANQVASIEILEEINQLRKQKEDLEDKIILLSKDQEVVSHLTREFVIEIFDVGVNGERKSAVFNGPVRLDYVFFNTALMISAKITEESEINKVLSKLILEKNDIDVEEKTLEIKDFVKIRSRFYLLNLIEHVDLLGKSEIWQLTQKGRETAVSLMQ